MTMTASRSPAPAREFLPAEIPEQPLLAEAEPVIDTPLRAALAPALADAETQDAALEIVTALEDLEREVSAPQQ